MIHYVEGGLWAWECITCHDHAYGQDRDDAVYLLGWHSGFAGHASINERVKEGAS